MWPFKRNSDPRLDEDQSDAELGELLRGAARLRQNISQERPSDHAGVALGSVRNLENGQGATVATLVGIVRALRLDGWLSGLQPVVSISPITA